MLKQCFTTSMIALALSAHGADYVSASGLPLKTGFGECVHTGYWTPASEPCEAPPVQLAMEQVIPPERVTHTATVLFSFDGDRLDDDARATLDRLLARYREIEKLYVTTHADRIGSERYNLALSERRLETVRNYLATQGITLPMLYAEARGEDQSATHCMPMKPENRRNKTLVECLRGDRRAEIEVVGAPRELARTAKRAE
jgi:OmpA-OmpF porin, OOP family